MSTDNQKYSPENQRAAMQVYADHHLIDIVKEYMRWGENGDAILTADVGYHTNAGERLRDSKYIIHLKCVAANLGYKTEDIHETRYSGNFRKEDFPEDIMSAGMPR